MFYPTIFQKTNFQKLHLQTCLKNTADVSMACGWQLDFGNMIMQQSVSGI